MRRIWARRILVGMLAGLLLFIALVVVRSFFPIDDIEAVRSASARYDLDPALTASLIRWESRFRSDAVSPKGAIGLMQIMPDTGAWIAERLGVPDFSPNRLFEVETNLGFGSWYLRTLIDRFSTVEQALWAYNAGPGHVEAWLRGEGSPFAETTAHVRRVLRSAHVYRVIWLAPHAYRAIPSL